MADISYTPEEAEAAAEALRYWFRLDTWTLREGLLLLVGIDPHRSECITIDENGKGFQLEGKGHPAPYWSRIGYPPDSSWTEEDMLAGRQPTITGLIFCPAEGYRLWELLNIWHANPELEGLRRARPLQFITLAESKGLAPYWLEAVRAKGILPVDGQKTTDMPKIGSTAPLQRQRHQESEILRVLHDLGYDPKSLPKNEPGKKGVKADVRSRLIFPKGVFDKAWERLLEGEISYSSESH